MVVELVGPAGVGKTTLAERLEATGKATCATIWLLPTALLARSTIRQLPMALALFRDTGTLLWDEVKHAARLDALHAFLRGPRWKGRHLVVLDEGPVYTLSYLQVMGHERFRHGGPERWWHETLRRWAGTVDAVVVLDAPNRVLASRIRRREKAHLMKDRSVGEVSSFSAAYRAAIRRVLAGLAERGGPPVITLEAGDEPIDGLSERLLEALERTNHAR
jgi:thymidylate kinase